MGRNVYICIYSLLFKNTNLTMRKYIILFCILSFWSISTFAQTASKGVDEQKEQYTKFIVKPKFPANLAFSFRKSTVTKMTQFLSDSTKRTYTRYLDLFFTYYSPGKAINGVTELYVSIDSLVWRYNRDGDSTYFDSQNDELVPPFNIEDFEESSIVLGRNFNFYYSPYWDFGKITGKKLIEDRIYINDPLDGILDTTRNYFWNYRLSDENLTEVVDVLKNLIPPDAIDTSMKRNIIFNYSTEEMAFTDTNTTVQLINENSRVYTLKATMNNLLPKRERTRIFGFGVFVDIIDCKGSGTYELDLTPQGRTEGARGEFNFDILFKDRREIIREKINEKVIYQLLKNYKI